MDVSNFPDSQQWYAPAGAWRLACGQAMGLRPRRPGTLEIVQGGVWLTVSGRAASEEDVFLRSGDTLRIAAGQHAVLEPWPVPGRTGGVSFLWTEEVSQGVPVASAWSAVAWALGDMFRAQGALGRALLALGRAVGNAAIGRRPEGRGSAQMPSAMALRGRH
ncbi:DUF2917 domain-containing protein [Paracidovorax avenae]|uniref:DUF2917 domain-containing protein n=1 Tax=Paracidovorax avenae TaxID=80867 RepID=UPI0006B35588|nr:DUF2917 domain-containing protein [Paracidovorax avenae]